MHMVRLRETNALCRELVEVGRDGLRVAITSQMRADILATDPEDIRPICRRGGGCHEQKQQDSEAAHG